MLSRNLAARLASVAAFGAACLLGAPATAEAAPAKAPAAWCGDGFEALPGDVCHIDGRAKNQAGGTQAGARKSGNFFRSSRRPVRSSISPTISRSSRPA